MSADEQELRERPIRSFVRRQGRITPAQRDAFDSLWAGRGLEPGDAPLDLPLLFPGCTAFVVEIGFGMGHTLAELAGRVFCHDAVEVLDRAIPDASLDGLLLFFPDPWHKKRHHKRRLVQPPFVALVQRKLKPGGLFHLATDWEDYARQMLEVVESVPGWVNLAGTGCFSLRPESRPLTRFEQRGLRLGHGVWDLLLRKGDDQANSASTAFR